MQKLKIQAFAQQQIKCILGGDIAKANGFTGAAVICRRKGKHLPPEHLILCQVPGEALYGYYLA